MIQTRVTDTQLTIICTHNVQFHSDTNSWFFRHTDRLVPWHVCVCVCVCVARTHNSQAQTTPIHHTGYTTL